MTIKQGSRSSPAMRYFALLAIFAACQVDPGPPCPETTDSMSETTVVGGCDHGEDLSGHFDEYIDGFAAAFFGPWPVEVDPDACPTGTDDEGGLCTEFWIGAYVGMKARARCLEP